MVFAHEFLVKPCDDKDKRKRKFYPVAPAAPERSMFYNRALSQSFGSRFSFEKFKNNTSENQGLSTSEATNKKDGHALVKKKQNWK